MTSFNRPIRECGWHVPEPTEKGVAHARRRRNHRHRRGSVLVVALVCLLVMMTIVSHMLLGSMRARRQLHPERNLRQTELLLQAGADRAAYRLATEAAYRGETWRLPADSIVGTGDADVTIQATRDSSDKPWQVQIMAEYPRGSEHSIRRSQTLTIPSQPGQKPQTQE
jgi:hypothetical protein